MIRIHRYFIYFIFAIVCIVLAFHSGEQLFAFIGIKNSFNILARIGLFVWAFWFYLLGSRGHVIYWSFSTHYRITYADFHGGYGLLYSLFGLGILLIFLGSFTTQQPTVSTPTKSQISFNGTPCIIWTAIDKSDVESNICIYGKVYSYGPYSNKWNTIQFSSNPDLLHVIDLTYYYTSPIQAGDCIVVYGRIRDNGTYLIITPYKDIPNSIRRGSSSACD